MHSLATLALCINIPETLGSPWFNYIIIHEERSEEWIIQLIHYKWQLTDLNDAFFCLLNCSDKLKYESLNYEPYEN